MDVTLVTTNPGKLREVRALLSEFGAVVRPLRRALPEPQSDSLDVVARAKLAAVSDLRGWVLVEDSGLFIPSLGGFPGVYSSHIYAIWGLDPILELLARRPRAAVFRTVAGLRRGRTTWYLTGECDGTIATSARGSGGFGFDPIFIPKGSRRTFAEMSETEKGVVSHRGRAMRSVGEILAESKK
ncbi:MAG: non-canonical purine NTP pyrophosphatase [Thermoplasmata archaeon]|nr:non-canonical purine NTP pyrophosphatase [Thermoplasmata archaeon]